MKVRRGLLSVFALVLAAVSLSPIGAVAQNASTGPVAVPLEQLFNNRGIAEGPDSSADFDGGRHAYSATATEHGDPVAGYAGLKPGQKITTGGFSFTWPDRPGRPDNVLARGQRVNVPAAAGATSLGLLGASINGPTSGEFKLNYAYTDAAGVQQQTTVTREVKFTDWTRGFLAGNPLQPNNTIVTKSLARHTAVGTVDYGYVPHVYLITTDLDPSMTLQSITLPSSSQIHLFGISVK